MKIRELAFLEVLVFIWYPNIVADFGPAIFALPAIFIYPSIYSVGLCLLGAVFGLVCLAALYAIEDSRRKEEMLSGFLRRFSGCNFRKFRIEDYAIAVNQNEYEAKNYPLKTQVTTIPHEVEEEIEIYVIKRGNSKSVPSQLTAYELIYQHNPCYIFVRDEPEKITSIGRFFLYHEIGHSSRNNRISRFYARHAWKQFAAIAVWVVVNIMPSLTSLVLLMSYILLLVVTAYVIHKYVARHFSFFEEINADRLALTYLSKEQRQSIKMYLSSVGVIPPNSSLTREQNLERSKLLLHNLNTIDDSPISERKALPVHQPALIVALFLSAILVPVMGFLGRKPSLEFLLWNWMLLGIPVTLTFLYWLKIRRLNREIGNVLSNTHTTSEWVGF